MIISLHHESIFRNHVVISRNNLIFFFGTIFASIAVTGPYLLKMIQLMNQTSGRSGNTLIFATGHPFNLLDTLGSLIFPPSAQAEGWYYFGIILFILLVWFLFYVVFKNIYKKLLDKQSSLPADQIMVFGLFIFVLLTSWITYGKDSVLFIFLWKYFPYFSSLRTWGRLNIVLLMLLIPIFGYAIESFIQNIKLCLNNKKVAFLTILEISIICIITGSIQIYLNMNRLYDPYWLTYFYYFSGSEISFLIKTIVALAVLIVIVGISIKKDHIKQNVFVTILVIFSLIDLWPCSSTMWKSGDFAVENDKRKILNISQKIIPDSLKFHRRDALMAADVALTPKFFTGYADDWYFARYKDFFTGHSFELESRSKLLGITGLDRLFLTSTLDYEKISDFLQDSKEFSGEISVQKYTGDVIVVDVESPRDGYLSFIDNWDPDWKASINDHPARIDLLFGTFKSVKVPKGKSIVKFEYQPSFNIIQ
jgi:hypothetical protein